MCTHIIHTTVINDKLNVMCKNRYYNPFPYLYAPRSVNGGVLFLPCLSVCLFVCLSVCLFVSNFNIGHNFRSNRDRDFIFCMHAQLMELHILMGQTSRSRVKVKGQINRSNGHLRDRDFIFCMHVQLIELHILVSQTSRPR